MTNIPRPSGQEERVRNYICEFAKARGLEYVTDAPGNVLVRRPGSGGGEAAPRVVIQNHLDMVTEKNADTEHDFLADPIRCLRDGDWITADGTTLGADNAVGAAAALALLDAPAGTKLPPLECLFTVDEETGMTGAFELDGSMITGRTLLNLDSEEWGAVFTGCAGGGDCKLTVACPEEPAPPGGVTLRLAVTGLLGGHSGLNINEDRGNATRILCDALAAVLRAAPGSRVAALSAGDKRNAISREGWATLVVPAAERAAAEAAVAACHEQTRAEFGLVERDAAVALAPAGEPAATVLDAAAAARLVALVRTLPHGVVKRSHALPGLVETSSNTASVKKVPGGYQVVTCSRSSLGHALERTRDAIRAIGEGLGATVELEDAYPGWQPDPSSAVTGLVRDEYRRLSGAEAQVGGIHAGLECGIIGERVGDRMDMVSFGPTITGAHSPDERVQVSTVAPFYQLTLAVLSRLADAR